jgi:hypothetical protein
MNANFSDIVPALNARVTRTGESAATANLPMGGFKHTGVANAAAATEYAAAGQVQNAALTWGGTSAGVANAQTITLSPGITGYVAGQRFSFLAGFTNTTAVTLAVSGNPATAIVLDDGVTPLGAGAIRAGAVVDVVYNGTSFVLLGPAASGWQFLSQTVVPGLAGAATFTLPSGFTRFRLEFSRMVPSSAAPLFARFSYDNGATYASGATEYGYSYYDIRNTGGKAAGSLNFIPLSNTTAANVFGMIEFTSTQSKHTLYDAACITTAPELSRIVGTSNSVTAGTATNVLLAFSGTNITAGGRIRLLGGL